MRLDSADKADMPRLLAVMGPTASGKSDLGLRLARRYNGEIISADSAQVYRGLDVGTAKPSAAERTEIPHHLIDICDLRETFSLARFQRCAWQACQDIWGRGRLPILVGGTGLYVRGFLEGYTLVEYPPDACLRQELETHSLADLLKELREVDAETYEVIDRCNKRRVVRALEIIRQTGRKFSECSQRCPPPLKSLKLALQVDKDLLNERIDRRLERMISSGWLQEAERLIEGGWRSRVEELRVLGYREMLACAAGEMELSEAKSSVAMLTKRFAKRQRTWLRAEPQAVAVNPLEIGAIENLVESFLS